MTLLMGAPAKISASHKSIRRFTGTTTLWSTHLTAKTASSALMSTYLMHATDVATHREQVMLHAEESHVHTYVVAIKEYWKSIVGITMLILLLVYAFQPHVRKE